MRRRRHSTAAVAAVAALPLSLIICFGSYQTAAGLAAATNGPLDGFRLEDDYGQDNVVLTDEQLSKFKEGFTYLDTDGDGEISKSELYEGEKALGLNPTAGDIDDTVYEADEDDSGTLNFPELLKIIGVYLRRAKRGGATAMPPSVMMSDDSATHARGGAADEQAGARSGGADVWRRSRQDPLEIARSGVTEDQLQRFEEVFHAFDRDENLGISIDELADGMRKLGFSPTEEQLRATFAEADADGSGNIEPGELMRLTAKYGLLGDGKAGIGTRTKAPLEGFGGEADDDDQGESDDAYGYGSYGDGAGYFGSGSGGGHGYTYDGHVYDMDQDRAAARMAQDNPEAFAAFHPKKRDEDLTYFKKAFALFDTDEDGVITAADLKRGLGRLGKEPSDAAVAAMIRQADVDGSGKIKFNDLLKISELAQQGEMPASDPSWENSVDGRPSVADLGRDLSDSRRENVVREKAAKLRKDLRKRGGLRVLH